MATTRSSVAWAAIASPRVVIDLGGVVRVDADGGVEPREPVHEGERPIRRRGVPARDQDPLDTGQAGAADDEVDIALEAIGVEVAVAVDQAHAQSAGVSASSRGKSGSGAATRPASARWAPQASSSRIDGPPLPSAPYG